MVNSWLTIMLKIFVFAIAEEASLRNFKQYRRRVIAALHPRVLGSVWIIYFFDVAKLAGQFRESFFLGNFDQLGGLVASILVDERGKAVRCQNADGR